MNAFYILSMICFFVPLVIMFRIIIFLRYLLQLSDTSKFWALWHQMFCCWTSYPEPSVMDTLTGLWHPHHFLHSKIIYLHKRHLNAIVMPYMYTTKLCWVTLRLTQSNKTLDEKDKNVMFWRCGQMPLLHVLLWQGTVLLNICHTCRIAVLLSSLFFLLQCMNICWKVGCKSKALTGIKRTQGDWEWGTRYTAGQKS